MGCQASKSISKQVVVQSNGPSAGLKKSTYQNGCCQQIKSLNTSSNCTKQIKVPNDAASTCTASTEKDSSHGSSRDLSWHSSYHSASQSVLFDLRNDFVAEGDLRHSVVRLETPLGKPIEEIYSGVHDGIMLGKGASGIVRLVTHRATGIKYAAKCLDTRLIKSQEKLKQLRDEIFIMCQLDHPNIVRIEEVYESNNEIYIIQELCVGGDLFGRLDEQPDFHFDELQCARLVKQMLSSLRYVHSKGIIHRDLKLENFLFSSTKDDSPIKMIDFGLSKHFEIGQKHNEPVGTPYTCAPEIITGIYDEKCDVWALGVIAYLMLSGETPFGGLDGKSLYLVRQRIERGQVHFNPPDVWEAISEEAKSFVQYLLNPIPAARPSAKDAQLHQWIHVWLKEHTTEDNQLSRSTLTALIHFKEASDIQKLLSEVVSFTLLPEQIEEFRHDFEIIDTEGGGEISIEAMTRALMQNSDRGTLEALDEEQIKGLLDSIRVRKDEPTITWHEFLAAGLSEAHIDDRNLRLAFDRLDVENKGFISYEDLEDLLGASIEANELERIWTDGLGSCCAKLDHITFPDFKRLLIMGQTDEGRQDCHQRVLGLSASFPYVPVASRPERLESDKSSITFSLSLEELGTFSNILHSMSLIRRQY